MVASTAESMAGSAHRGVAVVQLLVAGLLIGGIWLALPARYALVDGVGSGLAGLYTVSALGLLWRRRWSRKLALIASWIALVIGAALVSALALSMAHLSGQYGPIGKGGALLMGTIAALVLPYLVGLPVLQLTWLRRDRA